MSIKKTITAGAVTVLMLALTTACSGGSIQQQQVPSETDAPSVSATAEPTPVPTVDNGGEQATSFGFDLSGVPVPQEITDAHGDAANTVVADAAAALSLAVNENKDVQQPRTGAEADYYLAFESVMTPEAYQRLQENVAATVSVNDEADAKVSGFVQHVGRDGLLGEIDGVTYYVGEKGLRGDITAQPVLTLENGGEAGTQTVAVNFPMQYRAYTSDGTVLVYTANTVLFMTPGANGWLVDGYTTMNATAPVIQAGE